MPLTIKHTFVSEKPDGLDSTLIRPTNWNANHAITGTIVESDLTLADNTTGNTTTLRHGLAPKLSGNANQFLNGSGAFTVVVEAGITLADNTTNNVTTGRHGFVPKLSNDAATFLNGIGTFTTPAITEAGLTLADNTTDNVSTTRHGFVPKLPNDAAVFLNGIGTFTTPAGGGGGVELDDFNTWTDYNIFQNHGGGSGVTGVQIAVTADSDNSGSIVGLYVRNLLTGFETTQSHGIIIAVPAGSGESGTDVTDMYGLHIADHSLFATTGVNLNLFSEGITSHNLFQGFVSIENAVTIQSGDTEGNTIPLIVKANGSGQSADLTRWLQPNQAWVAKVAADGTLTARSLRAKVVEVDANEGNPIFDGSDGDIFKFTLQSGDNPTFINFADGQRVTIIIQQPSAEGEVGTLVWPNNVHGGKAPVHGALGYSVQEFVVIGSDLYASDSFLPSSNSIANDFLFWKAPPAGVDHDLIHIESGKAYGDGGYHNIADGNIRTTVVNISAASATNPVVLTVATTQGMVNGQQLAVSGATGTMATLLNQKHTINVLDGTTVELEGRDGTGLSYDGSGHAGTGSNSGDVTIFVLADLDEDELVFQTDDLDHGCIINTSGTYEAPVNRLRGDGKAVWIGTIVLHTADATFQSMERLPYAAMTPIKVVAGSYMDDNFQDTGLTLNPKGSVPEQFVSYSPGSTITLTDDGTGVFIFTIGDAASFAPWTLPDGKRIIIMLLQDVTGHAVTWGSQFVNPITVVTTPQTVTIQEFLVMSGYAFPLTEGLTGLTNPALPG